MERFVVIHETQVCITVVSRELLWWKYTMLSHVCHLMRDQPIFISSSITIVVVSQEHFSFYLDFSALSFVFISFSSNFISPSKLFVYFYISPFAFVCGYNPSHVWNIATDSLLKMNHQFICCAGRGTCCIILTSGSSFHLTAKSSYTFKYIIWEYSKCSKL